MNESSNNLISFISILNDPSHPRYEEAKSIAEELIRIFTPIAQPYSIHSKEFFEKMQSPAMLKTLQSARHLLAKIKHAETESDELIRIIKNNETNLQDFISRPQVNTLTLLSVMAKMDRAAKENAKKLISKNAQYAAKHDRPLGQHPRRENIKEHFIKWKNGGESYLNQADFIQKMQNKFKITRGETIREWIKKWEKVPLSVLSGGV